MSITSCELDSEGTPDVLAAADPGRTVTDFAPTQPPRRTTARFGWTASPTMSRSSART